MTKITATIKAPEYLQRSSELGTVEAIRDAVIATDSVNAAEQCVWQLLYEAGPHQPDPQSLSSPHTKGDHWHFLRCDVGGSDHFTVFHRGLIVLLIEETVEKTYHLLKDLGVYKAALKKNFHSYDRGPKGDETLALLKKRTQQYTEDELELLFAWCSPVAKAKTPLQVYTSNKKIRNNQRALKNFARLTGREVPVFGDRN